MAHAIPTYIGQPTPLPTVCPDRMDLLDRLASTIRDLGLAKLDLMEGDSLGLEAAQFEVQRLRGECASLRVALESHRKQHGC